MSLLVRALSFPGPLAVALLVALSGLGGCGGDPEGRARPVPSSVTWRAPAPSGGRPSGSAGKAVSRPVSAPPVARSGPASARPASVRTTARRGPARTVDWKNRLRPDGNGADLMRKGRSLLAAVARARPSLASGFFFPREVFVRLKRVGNPDRYWRHLLGLYQGDIRRLHRRHRDWTQVDFESLTLGSPVAWVRPGQVHNRIGYFRTRFARLRYRLGGKRYSIFLHTLITWQGRWYVTHLRPPPRRRKKP